MIRCWLAGRLAGISWLSPLLDPSWLLFLQFSWISDDFMRLYEFPWSPGVGVWHRIVFGMLSLKKALLDSNWLLFQLFSWMSKDFMRLHGFLCISWVGGLASHCCRDAAPQESFTRFPVAAIIGSSILSSCYHRFSDSLIRRIWGLCLLVGLGWAGLAGWLAGWLAALAGLDGWLDCLLAGCCLLAGRMLRRGDSKEFPHARRSGEVGG